MPSWRRRRSPWQWMSSSHDRGHPVRSVRVSSSRKKREEQERREKKPRKKKMTGGPVHLPATTKSQEDTHPQEGVMDSGGALWLRPRALLIPESGDTYPPPCRGGRREAPRGSIHCAIPHGVIPAGVHCRGGPVGGTTWCIRCPPGCAHTPVLGHAGGLWPSVW